MKSANKNPQCMICKNTNWFEILVRDNFKLLQCQNCGLIKTIRTGHIEFNDDQYIDPDEPRKQFETKKHIYQPAVELLMSILLQEMPDTQGKKMLDVGCGLGWMLSEAEKKGFEAFGIDSSKTFITQGQQLLGVKSKVAQFENFKTNQKYDLIVLSHVVEHIPDLPSFLTKIRSLLKPNGLVLIACPNINSVMFDVLQDKWYALAPGQHLWQFAKPTLTRILQDNGFVIKKMTTTNLYHEAFGWRAKIKVALIHLWATLTDRGGQLVCVAGINNR